MVKNNFYKILVANKNCVREYIYCSDIKIDIYQIVQVEFGKVICFGIVIGLSEQLDNIKSIIKIIEHKLDENFMEFLNKFSNYYFLNIGAVLEMVFPAIAFQKGMPLLYNFNEKIFGLQELLDLKFKKSEIAKLPVYENEKFISNNLLFLDEDQKNAVNFIKNQKEPIILEGATGSGKTIVALESVKDIDGKILILVPEISLAKNWEKVIRENFNQFPFIFNSQVKDLYKKSLYNWVISEKSGFIIGARSALLLPYKNLKAIIIDEEHSVAFKQDRYPYYHGRDMAVLKGHIEKIPVLLMSATPSLETFYNVENKKYKHYKLLRMPKYGLAKIEYIKNSYPNILASNIILEVEKIFQKNQQVLFFLNRKGFVPYCICNECKSLLKCIACDCAKTLYKNFKVICHKCYHTSSLPNFCLECKKKTTWNFFGIGVEKVEECLSNIFKDKKFMAITSDSLEIDSMLKKIENNEVNGIIATQILAQGHDFKNIGLVIVVDADMGLSSTDFRSLERIHQLWNQIRGRSGRHDIQGKMIIQYIKENNKFIELFKCSDPIKFLKEDRKSWPPYSRCMFLKIKGKDKNYIEKELIKLDFGSEFLGPIYYGVSKFIHEFRYLIKISKKDSFERLIKKMPKIKGMKFEFEVDPYSF